MTIQRHHLGARISEMVVHDGTVYLAGQVANDPSLDATGQAREVLANIDRLLGEVGSNKTKVLSATIYLANIADFAAMNVAWDEWLAKGHQPARATVQAQMFKPEYRVEMQIIAAL
jgi:enamine deaminase RidA (YjgF/YER057c/UK114 family)